MAGKNQYTLEVLRLFSRKGQQQLTKRKKWFEQLKQKDTGEVDRFFHSRHEEVFAQFDCLQCANCCKTISPIITQKDMERLAKQLKISVSVFLQQYLFMDEDGDFVFKQTPCPFLGADNYCSVYNSRPDACREYPHTNRRKMKQILDLTYLNSLTCPAVWKMVERFDR
ncbi:MAG: YkgJ family cysteine cluster protein [Bacteroidia bacterium]|nr:YkgJ family cysteine cluster protein [Bacteroidia bacterium]